MKRHRYRPVRVSPGGLRRYRHRYSFLDCNGLDFFGGSVTRGLFLLPGGLPAAASSLARSASLTRERPQPRVRGGEQFTLTAQEIQDWLYGGMERSPVEFCPLGVRCLSPASVGELDGGAISAVQSWSWVVLHNEAVVPLQK